MDMETKMKRREIVLASAGAAMATVPTWGLAQGFPKPGTTITYVEPFAPGGLSDTMARTVAAKLSEAWKVSVIGVTTVGGNAHIGAVQVAKSAPDGRSLLAIP